MGGFAPNRNHTTVSILDSISLPSYIGWGGGGREKRIERRVKQERGELR
jgi:hypothetical protein